MVHGIVLTVAGAIFISDGGEIFMAEEDDCGCSCPEDSDSASTISGECCEGIELPYQFTISWTDSTGGAVEGSGGEIVLTYEPNDDPGEEGMRWVFFGIVPGQSGEVPQQVVLSCSGGGVEAGFSPELDTAVEGVTFGVMPCEGPYYAPAGGEGTPEEGELAFTGIEALDAVLTG